MLQLSHNHIKRLINYLDSTYADTKKLRQGSITAENYQSYYENYREINTFISHLETEDSELQKLFDIIPSLPSPNSLPLKVNALVCSLNTSVTIFFTAFFGFVLFTMTAPVSIPLFIYGQIRIREITRKLEIIEISSPKLSFLLRSVNEDTTKIITTSQTSGLFLNQ